MGFPSGLGASFSGGIGSLGGDYLGGVRPAPDGAWGKDTLDRLVQPVFGPAPDGAMGNAYFGPLVPTSLSPNEMARGNAYFGPLPHDYFKDPSTEEEYNKKMREYNQQITGASPTKNLFSPPSTTSKPTRGGADLMGQAPTPTQPVGGIAQQYMNPYLSAALQPQLDELRRQADISRSRLGAKFGGAGGGASAFGGGRHGIESSELERSMLGEMGKTLSSGYMTAFDKAREQFNTEQQQKRAQAEMLASAGREQQFTEQAAIDAQMKQFQEAQMWPYKQLEFQRNLLAGLPVGTQTMTPTSSGFADLIGGIGSLLNLRGMLS